MRLVVVFLAASLVGADRPKGPETTQIVYQVKFLEMNGLGWRSSLHAQLQPVARQGSATVWTTSRETASKLAEKAGQVVAAPRVTSLPEVRSTIFQNSTRKIVAEVTREADGPVNHASFVGYVPRVEDATEGYSAEVAGRKLDQGVLANLTLVDRRITAVHTVPLTEILESRTGRQGERTTPAEVTIQIPEYARTAVSGEWLIPKDGVLLVSLGVHTIADPKGKAVVHERLAVFEAAEAEGQFGMATASPMTLDLPLLRTAMAMANRPAEIPMPMGTPALPGRSLPRPLDATGQPVELPPLPDPATTVTMLPGTSEPCASPQANGPAVAGAPTPWKKSQTRDAEASLTGLTAGQPAPANSARGTDDKAPAPPCCDAEASCAEDEPAATVNRSHRSGKSIRFSIPLNATFKIEVDARVTPTPSPSSGVGGRD